jgi:hypothetical protein
MIGMAPGLPRARFNSSKFIRQLADGAVADVADSPQTFGERLGPWLAWTDAISLSAVLNQAGTAARPPASRSGTSLATRAAVDELASARAELAKAIVSDAAFVAAETEPAHCRRRYTEHQRTMETRIPVLRAKLRAALAGHSPGLARLAALDAVMDEALAARERHLLSTVHGLLEQRYRRMCLTLPERPARYGQEVQGVLLAELDLRWQPIDGMLEALKQAHKEDTRQP